MKVSHKKDAHLQQPATTWRTCWRRLPVFCSWMLISPRFLLEKILFFLHLRSSLSIIVFISLHVVTPFDVPWLVLLIDYSTASTHTTPSPSPSTSSSTSTSSNFSNHSRPWPCCIFNLLTRAFAVLEPCDLLTMISIKLIGWPVLQQELTTN